MKPKGRIVLIELLIAFLFFSLAAVIALQLFAHGQEFSRQSTLRSAALRQAQSLAERLYASNETEALLRNIGFEKQDSAYTMKADGALYKVSLSASGTEAGVIQNMVITAYEGEKELFTLPVSRYEGGKAP